MLRTSSAQHGFTLLELLISVTIMTILIGGSIAGFITFQTRQEVLAAAKTMQQLVKTAQGKARVRETPTAALVGGTTCNSAGSRLQGYRMEVSGNTMYIKALCGSSTTSYIEAATVQTQDLPSGITYSGPQYTDFFTLYRGISISGGAPGTYAVSNGSVQYSFTVSAGGAISEVE